MRNAATLILLLVFVGNIKAKNYKFQALFMYNIAQRIEWPNVSGDFTIGVIGCKDIHKELNEIALKRSLLGHKIQVIDLNPDQLNQQDCHIIYVGTSSSNKLDAINTSIGLKPSLIITNKNGLTGSGINFIDDSEKIEFEIFPSVIKQHQLKLAASLLSLGTVKE
ncbi:MAG: YfiR family protein [Carboxylicivirga sp.]|jgi:hypothetical protein|nr:YfiR family protein [Carboxylicivirga sp.]